MMPSMFPYLVLRLLTTIGSSNHELNHPPETSGPADKLECLKAYHLQRNILYVRGLVHNYLC